MTLQELLEINDLTEDNILPRSDELYRLYLMDEKFDATWDYQTGSDVYMNCSINCFIRGGEDNLLGIILNHNEGVIPRIYSSIEFDDLTTYIN